MQNKKVKRNGLLLLAGTGSRLSPLTDTRPKCLVEIGGKSLLQWQVESLRLAGISKISAVVGYRGDQVQAYPHHGIDQFYFNPDYASSNMVETLMCAEPELKEGVVISYGDIIYSPHIVKKLMGSTSDISVVVDQNWFDLWSLRFQDPLQDAETLVMNENGFILEIGQKAKDLSQIMAQYIGLIQLSFEGAQQVKASYHKAKEEIARGQLAWGKIQNLKKAYMTDLLQGLIYEGKKIEGVPICGNWFEVDSLSDYELYQNLIKQASPSKEGIYNIGRSDFSINTSKII